ncbi:MAG: hypothetical protein R6X14_00555 [bacterium]
MMNRRTGTTPQRFDPDQGPRRRVPWWLVAAPLALLALFLFLRGPNGLVQMARRWHEVRSADAGLARVRRQLDSLAALRNRFSDTAFVRRYAAEVLGAEPATDTTDTRPGDAPGLAPGSGPESPEEPPAPAETEPAAGNQDEEFLPPDPEAENPPPFDP